MTVNMSTILTENVHATSSLLQWMFTTKISINKTKQNYHPFQGFELEVLLPMNNINRSPKTFFEHITHPSHITRRIRVFYIGEKSLWEICRGIISFLCLWPPGGRYQGLRSPKSYRKHITGSLIYSKKIRIN